MAQGKTADQLAEEMSRFEQEISGVGPPRSAQTSYSQQAPGLATRTAAVLGVQIPGQQIGVNPVGVPHVGAFPSSMPAVPGVFPPAVMGAPLMPMMPIPAPAPGSGVPLVPPMPGMVPVPVVMPPVAAAVPTDRSVAGASSSGSSSAAAAQVKDEQKWASQFSQKTVSKTDKKKRLRTAAGVVWEDSTMDEWDQNDFRLFCGDLGHEVSDEVLRRAFSRYPSLQRGKIVRDKRTGKSRGYGFISFKDPKDYMSAMREMNGKYIGSRPVKLRKSTWKDRQLDVARKKMKEKERLGLK